VAQTSGTDEPGSQDPNGSKGAHADDAIAFVAPGQAAPPPPVARPGPLDAPAPPTTGAAPPTRPAGPPGVAGWTLAGRLITIRPMRIGEMIDGAFQLLRRAWAPSVVIVLVLVGPLDLLSGWVQDLLGFTDLVTGDLSGLEPNSGAAEFTSEDLETIITTGIVVVGLGFLTLIVSAIANGAVTRAAVMADEGRRPVWTEAVAHALKRTWPLVGSTLLVLAGGILLLAVALGVLVGLVVVMGPAGAVIGGLLALALVVPGLLLFAIFYLSVPVIVIEDTGPVRALRRSAELVRPQVWRVVGIAVLASIALNLAVASVGVAGSALVFAAGPIGGLVAGLFSVVQRLLILPVSAFVALLLYVDARTRREGLDIEARIAQLPPPVVP